MILRPYQERAVRETYDFLRRYPKSNPLIVIPTGGGKTPVLATIARDVVQSWGGRALILSHVKELVEQSAEKLKLIDPSLDVGVYSAGLNSRDTGNKVVSASIQSVYKRAGELGSFDMVLVDEAHLIPPDGEGMYRTFLNDAKVVNPRHRLVGLTATPYRMSTGLIYGTDGLFSDISYDVGVRELIADNYLSPLVSKRAASFDETGLHRARGEFLPGEVQDLMLQTAAEAVGDMLARTKDRKSVIVFTAGVEHAVEICNILHNAGETVELITGDTPDAERASTIGQFKSGEVRFLVNVNVLTTGFDAPGVDCVALMRSTLSVGLYYQMVGRGFRLSPGKRDCLVLDYGGNVKRHGPVDKIEIQAAINRQKIDDGEPITKVCPKCDSEVTISRAVCPDCGHTFPIEEKPKHDTQAGDDAPLSGEVTETEYEVFETEYAVHTKRNADESAPKTMRVDYRIGASFLSEWVCIEHEGFAGGKAQKWWKDRTGFPFPSSAAEAVEAAKAGKLCTSRTITVREVSGEKFPRIIDAELVDNIGRPPEASRQPGEDDEPLSELEQMQLFTSDDVPF